MHNISEFTLDEHKYGLTLVEDKMAARLYDIIRYDRNELGRWCPWANHLRFIDDEIDFIKRAQQNCLFILAILDGHKPIGIIDLHNFDDSDRTCEVGYWLFSKYQGRGIMYNCLQVMNSYAFNFFDIEKLKIIADRDNTKSQKVAKRAGFKLSELHEPYSIYIKKKTDL
ncbi:hypothetical protein FD43_GL001138 [Apilactobacillus kunkeei DSM 12361 = ATCC 700308]|uniref:N-acetyltransferase domain-containing protein n=1 Tax=Apilactobacillus kunkeei DSM 12361 = ATCC 700308 TaxID=1423768 RepID=A0A0R1FQS9_9LACO|nr:GNAT family N-acetyltransferase [Apilactobacillus kunkeei]KOY74662.1 Acetyltransferase, including N-acetylase of ribosomal protein [Apilactobacillus kunkeei DSM 12361 = ATCC 700308]KRK24326.1 hypothetical protein FD43_GL001138 [Apilactobacillus kunkeei DSM 12361 = ATCC 700308]QYU53186.1 GNAT family N-acetyltransferase [Apilactobacillus kunkeei]